MGNYLYNGVAMDTGAFGTVSLPTPTSSTTSVRNYLTTRFQTKAAPTGDHYVENASFLKMDNLQIGYHFGQINRFFSLNLSAMIQNV